MFGVQSTVSQVLLRARANSIDDVCLPKSNRKKDKKNKKRNEHIEKDRKQYSKFNYIPPKAFAVWFSRFVDSYFILCCSRSALSERILSSFFLFSLCLSRRIIPGKCCFIARPFLCLFYIQSAKLWMCMCNLSLFEILLRLFGQLCTFALVYIASFVSR